MQRSPEQKGQAPGQLQGALSDPKGMQLTVPEKEAEATAGSRTRGAHPPFVHSLVYIIGPWDKDGCSLNLFNIFSRKMEAPSQH